VLDFCRLKTPVAVLPFAAVSDSPAGNACSKGVSDPVGAGGGGVVEGQEVAFTGFPIGAVLGMTPVTHRGIVSAITPIAIPQANSRDLNPALIRRLATDPFRVYQLDATAYPGNSGSPLYEPYTGRVVGVVNKVFVQESKEAALERPSGISYAIPVRHVQALLKRAGVPSG